jgi:FimV-like protein
MSNALWLVAMSLMFATFVSQASDYVVVDSLNGLQLAQSSATEVTTAVVSNNAESSYGPVRRNENLWQISKRNKSDSMTMSQLIMSIYHSNRSAFLANNINRLRTGVILKIPSANKVLAIDYKQAYAEVTAHIADYETYISSNKQAQTKSASVEELTPSEEPTSIGKLAVSESDQTNLKLKDIEVIKKELIQEQLQVEQNIELTETPEVTVKPGRERAKKPRIPLFRYSYDLSVAHDDNIRRAQNEIDIRSDSIINMTLNARAGESLSSFTLLSYGASISAEKFSTFEELDNISFDANVKFRFAFAAGFTSPIYSIGLKVGGIESDKVARDSSVYSLSLGVNKWITNTLNLSIGLDHKQRESRSRVFDTTENRMFANLDINLSKTDLVYTTYTYIAGDIVSSATPTLAIINASDVIEPDDAFGGIATNQFAYRLDSDTQVATLGYNTIISEKTSVDFSYRYIKTESAGNIEYDRSIFRASLLGRF